MRLADSTAAMHSKQPPKARVLAIGASVTPKPIRKNGLSGSGKPCGCGKCFRCLDDAKWERIFREKFVDANYYSTRMPKACSPLNI